MQVYQIPVTGVFTTNCYIWLDEKSGHGFLIDPGAQPDELADLIEKKGWTIDGILLTHGHFDHIGGVNELRRRLNVPAWGSPEIEKYAMNPHLNLSADSGLNIQVPDIFSLREHETISSDYIDGKLEVISVPGHTEDSILFYDGANNRAFVGDAIFKGQPGIWTYPTGNRKELLESIENKILCLPDNTTLYSGHTTWTTVRAERPLYGMR